ncbi:E3 ubiquitin-protein ligase ubr1 [Plectosphaerella cucumerina]|uniref:E3 ubiquitin-protein ligase n=1 Tax=Plectosphaerella cucumerina TaxID=40658 RepID=A0A8K0THU5_9PEZI|nr:E3 ubiquitin-protein ligase ubr1 [Plectosphaerella cucumerina]
MEQPMSTQERQLCEYLRNLPSRFDYRYDGSAPNNLLESLFWSLAGGERYIGHFFPQGRPSHDMKLKDAQGALEGAEYTEAARGKRCGHIFKAGEASYHCRTCSTDDTCVLCSRCFDSTDHQGHMVRISISVGNSGCCDCGDDEAWRLPMFCTIHSEKFANTQESKGKETAGLPEDLVQSMQMTIGRVFDFICDVISCSPEQLRQTKTAESIRRDEEMSRLSSEVYGEGPVGSSEFALVLWNDEKHTVEDVQKQIARACRTTEAVGLTRATETDFLGRSILKHLDDLDTLLEMAKKLEEIKVTVTIRSSRDTFREQMCGTMIEWLSDISGCSVGNDHHILRQIVCQEMMKPWKQGSPGTNAMVGKDGIYDEEQLHRRAELQHALTQQFVLQMLHMRGTGQAPDDDDDDDMSDEDDIDMGPIEGTPSSQGGDDDEDDVMMVDTQPDAPADIGIDWRANDQSLEEDEATMAGYPPPPPPPPVTAGAPATAPRRTIRDRDVTPSDSDTAEPLIAPAIYAKANIEIPKIIGQLDKNPAPKPGRYWLEAPPGYVDRGVVPPAEDVFQRVRLDRLILFDLRMWKKMRNDLRSLYISTVVSIPEFKRILGLRFAGLYTALAQLYLIGDREPDHSIINLSLQMLTTPSITAEIVERGNFMTSLLSILYTFLTTRQVGYPWDVSSNAVLAFDSGSVTNRRMYHFYLDLKYLFGSPHVQEKLRSEQRYLLQFLDLVKLHQGIGPNVRAVGEHVEYETDSWITASLVTREINRLARQLADSFRSVPEEESHYVDIAIRTAAKTVILNSIGAERHRFKQAEIKEEVKFKTLGDFEFDLDAASYDVIKFTVEDDPISLHHALHYTLSWLIECGKSRPASSMRALLSFTAQDLLSQPKSMGRKTMPRRDNSAEDLLMATFDYPLRVCAWLAQIKANMWVRNGMSLRHQAATYRGVNQRDVSHHRDIFLLQSAMVICNPNRVLVSIIDRFGMEKWVKGLYEQKSAAQDDAQHLDVVEDMIHLLIVLLSDRTSLITTEDEPNSGTLAIRRDILHTLCFKPLSFNEISNKLPEKFQEQEDFHRILDEMTIFKPPEGVSDVGTFELKDEFLEYLDPYIAHYNKNQREESEMAYRKKMARRTGKPLDEIVYEPKLRLIPSGLFEGLSDFTGTGMFAQIIYYSLLYPLVASRFTPTVPATRIETFLQVVLHLVLVAVTEDNATEDDADLTQHSFITIALSRVARSNFMADAPDARTIVALLEMMSTKEDFKACHPKLALILKRMRQKRPRSFETAYIRLGVSVDRIETASPANNSAEEERERKKKAALSRQAKVMAHFQQQQKSFLDNQGDIDWGSDLEEDEDTEQTEDRKNTWKYPTGTCILCQEDTDDRRLYGTFAMFNQSMILRQTDFQDADFVREAFHSPANLDRSAEEIRPFGVAHENRQEITKINAAGEAFSCERQTIGKGFPAKLSRSGPVSTGCGHMMHFSCFEAYIDATTRRHHHQIARHPPEDLRRKEFVCPLCKALGNAFLPIIWKGQEESYPSLLQPQSDFGEFLAVQMRSGHYIRGVPRPPDNIQAYFAFYNRNVVNSTLADKMTQLYEDAWNAEDSGSEMNMTTPMSSFFSAANTPLSSRRPASATDEALGQAGELVKVYRRIRDTIQTNRFKSRHPLEIRELRERDEIVYSDVLVRLVGYSISAAEIQQRGTEAQYGLTLLDKIPELVLTHLRILSETTTSYIATGGMKSRGDNRVDNEFRKDSERQHCQLFMSQYFGEETENASRPVDFYPPLMLQDSFLFLSECVFGLVPAHGFDVGHVLRLCYLAEIVKTVHHMSRNIGRQRWLNNTLHSSSQNAAHNNFAQFCVAVSSMGMDVHAASPPEDGTTNAAFAQAELDSLESYYVFVRKYALCFLRKSAILMYVKYGVDLNSHVSPTPDADELDRLAEALKLPNFDQMCAALTDHASSFGWPASTSSLVSGWVRHHIMYIRPLMESRELPDSAQLSHPGIFELVGLPKHFDTLIEEATKRRCPTTGLDISDPMICLLCGEVFCGQAVCCLKERVVSPDREPQRIGGSQQHMAKCQQNIGLFLNIRKCCIFYLFRQSGSYSSAPYIDKYGETDLGLRHGRQLFLNQRRYDSMLRNTFLSHGIPSFISRKLESEINNGGWETI